MFSNNEEKVNTEWGKNTLQLYKCVNTKSLKGAEKGHNNCFSLTLNSVLYTSHHINTHTKICCDSKTYLNTN